MESVVQHSAMTHAKGTVSDGWHHQMKIPNIVSCASAHEGSKLIESNHGQQLGVPSFYEISYSDPLSSC